MRNIILKKNYLLDILIRHSFLIQTEHHMLYCVNNTNDAIY